MQTEKQNKKEQTLPQENKRQPEQVTAEAEKAAAKKAKPEKPAEGRKKINTNKLKRGGLSTLMIVVFLVLVIGVNLLASLLANRFPSMNADLTAQGLNTLSEEAVDAAKNVKYDTKIIILADEEAVRKGNYNKEGFSYTQVVSLAERLEEVNGKISVSFVDMDKEPTFKTQAEYKDDNLTVGSVIVETEKRHRVLTLNDLFAYTQDQTTGAYDYYSQVDGAMANALNLVNLDSMPLVAISTANNAQLDTTALQAVLEGKGFEVKTFDLLTEEVPENALVVLLPSAQTDLTKDQAQKLRDYLGSSTADSSRSLFYITSLANGADSPNLQGLLEEWGVKIEPGVVVETDTSKAVNYDNSGIPYGIIASNAGEILESNSYSMLISPQSTALTPLFTFNDNISVKKLWVSSPGAYVATDGLQKNPETSQQVLATLSTKSVKKEENKYTTENVVVFGSAAAFMDGLGNNDNFGNKAYITDLFSYVTGVDNASMVINKVNTYTLDITASTSTLITLGLGIFTVAIPLVILVIGLVVFIRRRHL